MRKYLVQIRIFRFMLQWLKVEERAVAPGAFRPDLTNPVVVGEGLKWGISMVPNKHE
jgi:hypothetical protein